MQKVPMFLLLTSSLACAPPNWQGFRNSQFPSYVQEIEFPANARLNLGSRVSFGSWTVRFKGPALPIMVGYNGSFIFTIHGLMAHNEVVGDFPCILYYMDGATFGAQKRGDHNYQWNLGILEAPWDPSDMVSSENHPTFYRNGIISIPFPAGIQLKR